MCMFKSLNNFKNVILCLKKIEIFLYYISHVMLTFILKKKKNVQIV